MPSIAKLVEIPQQFSYKGVENEHERADSDTRLQFIPRESNDLRGFCFCCVKWREGL